MGIPGFTRYLTGLGLPAPDIMAWVVATFHIVVGLLLVVGFMTRWTALVVALFVACTIFLGHRFWAVEPAQFTTQLNFALKNIAIIGGLLILAAFGPGRHSVDARAGGRWGTRARY
jgi:putative oxidoreductase